jgi:hypothetical protein
MAKFSNHCVFGTYCHLQVNFICSLFISVWLLIILQQQLEELEEKLQKETSSLKKQLQDAEEQLHGTHKLSSVVSEVIGHVIQPAESNMVLSTPSKHSSSPHWNSSTEGFIPVQSAVTVSQQDMENKLEITLLKREEGEVIQLIPNSLVIEPSGSTPLIPSLL